MARRAGYHGAPRLARAASTQPVRGRRTPWTTSRPGSACSYAVAPCARHFARRMEILRDPRGPPRLTPNAAAGDSLEPLIATTRRPASVDHPPRVTLVSPVLLAPGLELKRPVQ